LTHRSRIEGFYTWLLSRGRFPFLFLTLLLSAFLGIFALRVPVETDNASMISIDAEQRRVEEGFRKAFGGDEELFLAVTPPSLLSPEGLRYLSDLSAWIGRQDGVLRVFDLTNARLAVPGTFGVESAPVVPPDLESVDLRERIEAGLNGNPKLAGLLISRDRRTAGITIEISDRPGDGLRRAALIRAIRGRIARDAGTAEIRLTGVAVLKNDVAELVRKDKTVLLPLSALVLASGLAFAFRRLDGVLVTMAVKGIGLVWTLGLYSLSGYSLNPITSLLPPLIVVISVSNCVHIFAAWLENRDAAPNPVESIAGMVRGLFLPCLGTSVTTALGLLALAVSDTPAVRLFGFFGALGTMISFFAAMTLMPVALSFLPAPARREPSPGGVFRGKPLENAARLSTAHAAVSLGIVLVLSAAGAAGILRVRNNTDLVRFLKPESTLYRDTMFIDARFPGVYSLEFLLSRRDGRPMTTPDDLGRLASFEAAALDRANVGDAYSIVDVIGPLHAADTGSVKPRLPDDEEGVLQAIDLLKADPSQPFLSKLMSRDLSAARLSVRVHAVGTSEAAPLGAALLEEGRRILGNDYSVVPAGNFFRVVRDSDRLVRRSLLGLFLALLAIVAAVSVLFRSARLALASLAPTVLPPLAVGGLMGAVGIDLSTGTAMAGPVALGLVADDTIHFIARFRKESVIDPREAIARTVAGTGRWLAASSLILAFGFGVGAFGSFRPTVHFSILAGGTMLAALACVLLVLPACLGLAFPAVKGAAR
jgi:predicted RND superfamily exporter protein